MPESSGSTSSASHLVAGLAGAVLVAIVFGALALGGVFDGKDGKDASTPIVRATGNDDTAEAPKSSGSVVATNVADLYENVRPGVVSIQARTADGGATGSGFVLDKAGNILTNDHVIEDASRVRVRFAKGDPVGARVVATDPSTDLALLRVKTSSSNLQPLALGDSKGIRVGEPAIALGSPFGLDGTLTTGVVSQLGRTIQAPNNFQIDNVLQTDAAINPGNSGGPLLDDSGRVIGVNAQIATSTQSNSGVGFAIPIATAKEVLPQLKAGRDIKRPYLGVSTTDSSSGDGALVAQVVPDGPADDAGLRLGDRMTALGGKAIEDSDAVASAVSSNKPGDKVKVTIRRGGSERDVTVTLGTRPKNAGGSGGPSEGGGILPGRP